MHFYSEVREAGTCVVGFVSCALPRFFEAYFFICFAGNDGVFGLGETKLQGQRQE